MMPGDPGISAACLDDIGGQSVGYIPSLGRAKGVHPDVYVLVEVEVGSAQIWRGVTRSASSMVRHSRRSSRRPRQVIYFKPTNLHLHYSAHTVENTPYTAIVWWLQATRLGQVGRRTREQEPQRWTMCRRSGKQQESKESAW